MVWSFWGLLEHWWKVNAHMLIKFAIVLVNSSVKVVSFQKTNKVYFPPSYAWEEREELRFVLCFCHSYRIYSTVTFLRGTPSIEDWSRHSSNHHLIWAYCVLVKFPIKIENDTGMFRVSANMLIRFVSKSHAGTAYCKKVLELFSKAVRPLEQRADAPPPLPNTSFYFCFHTTSNSFSHVVLRWG